MARLALAVLPLAAAFMSGGRQGLPAARPASSRRCAQLSRLEAKYKVAVVGGGPSGACAAEIFAEEKNIETYIIERKLDNAKPCGGAIPLCMVDEFDLPLDIIDRQVRRMKMISPSNREVESPPESRLGSSATRALVSDIFSFTRSFVAFSGDLTVLIWIIVG